MLKDEVKTEADKFYNQFKTEAIDKQPDLKKKLADGGLDEAESNISTRFLLSFSRIKKVK